MEQLLGLLPEKSRSPVADYAITTVLVGLCFLVVAGLHGRAGLLAFYLLFPAIFISAILFDRATGTYATVLSTVLLYLLIKPGDSLLLQPELALPLAMFVLISLGLAIVSGGLRVAWERAVAAEGAKDLLLDELRHRTKNDLSMVISVLSLQARGKTNPEARQALEKAVERVRAIARAHDHFQPSKHTGTVDMRYYLEELCSHLGDALREVRPIAVRVHADEIFLSIEQAIPIGLIVNELVTNALKHAFPEDRGGVVEVALTQGSPITLTVADDGVGCAVNKTERLGSRLTRLLAQQLGATIVWEDANPGCKVRVVVDHR